MFIACILLNYCDRELTKKTALRIAHYQNIDMVIVIDNDSPTNDYNYLRSIEQEKIIVRKTSHNGGYGFGNNYGISIAKQLGATHVIISNPDVVFSEMCIDLIIQAYNHYPYCACISPATYYKGKCCVSKLPTKWQLCVESLSLYNRIFGRKTTYQLDEIEHTPFFPEVVMGAMTTYNLAVLDDIRYDEAFFLYCEELVIATKLLRKGLKTMLIQNATYDHVLSHSIDRQYNSMYKKRKLATNSKLMYLRKYLDCNEMELLLFGIVLHISNFEALLHDVFYSVKRDEDR